MHLHLVIWLVTLSLLGGCMQCSPSKTPMEAASSCSASDPSQLSARGKVVYASNCTACHNADPAKAGNLGPEVKGSSRELLEARIVHGTYPDGYTPKRPESKAMAALPYLKNEIDALHAFLNQGSP